MKKNIFLLLLAVTTLSFAQKTTAVRDTIAKDTTKTKVTEKTPEQKRAEEYAKLIKKGGIERTGLFTVRKIEEKWYFEIPDTLLNRYLLCVTRLKTAPDNFGMYAGEKVNEQTIYFEQRTDKTLSLRAFVNVQQADSTHNIYTAVANSSANPIIASFNVIGRNPKTKSQLIDVTDFFKQDNSIISFSSSFKTAQKLGNVALDRSYVEDMRPYPINVEINAMRTFSASPSNIPAANRVGAVSVGLNVSIVLLPKEPMAKRLFDPRVGFFASRFVKFGDDQQRTETEAYIHRFRLEPRKEDMKKYLAKPWPNDPSMSMEDARFCVIRYLPSEISNAYGPNIADPRSGEIIECHVGWYHNVMKLLQEWYMIQVGAVDKRARTLPLNDELMGDLIRFVSSHEIGHCLGLRHNMGASYATPVEKLRDKAWVEAHGHTASIMDYARFNYVAQPEDNISSKGIYPRVGDYDKWAIEWGYRYYGNKYKDEYAEQEALADVTTQRVKANPRLWFGGEGNNEDPRAQREDLSDNVMKANTYGLKNLKYVVQNLPQWTKQPNDKYDYLLGMHQAATQQYRRYLNHVLKYIGNRYVGFVGDKEVYKEVPKEKVKEAVAYIDQHLFTTPLWLYPQEITDKIGVDVDASILGQQNTTLAYLLAEGVVYRIANQALVSQNPYTADEYLNDVFAAVWKPLNASEARQNTYRRGAQRAYIEQLGKLINPENKTDKIALNQVSDVRIFALQNLNKVEKYLQQAQQGEAANSINQLHYQQLLKDINNIKEPKK